MRETPIEAGLQAHVLACVVDPFCFPKGIVFEEVALLGTSSLPLSENKAVFTKLRFGPTSYLKQVIPCK